MKYIVDRIEENIAVCMNYDEKIYNIPLDFLPEGIKEGDVIKIEKDDDEKQMRMKKINSLFEKVTSK